MPLEEIEFTPVGFLSWAGAGMVAPLVAISCNSSILEGGDEMDDLGASGCLVGPGGGGWRDPGGASLLSPPLNHPWSPLHVLGPWVGEKVALQRTGRLEM